MHILILNDGSEYQNWGIKACIDGLNLLIQDAYPSANITSISHGVLHRKFKFEPKFRTHKFFSGDGPLERRFQKELLPTPRFADDFERVWKLWKTSSSAQEMIGKIEQSEIVVFNGEGSSYRSNYAAIKCLFILWVAKNICKKKTFFVNGSITLSDVDNVLQGVVERSLSNADGIIVRENISLLQLRKRLPNLRAVSSPDSVFALNHLLLNVTDTRTSDVAFSASMLPMDFRTDVENSALIPFLTNLLGPDGRLRVLAKDLEDLDAAKLLRFFPGSLIGPENSYTEVSKILSRTKGLVSGRYHHLIFALMSGTLVIPFDTSSHKITGLARWYEEILSAPIDPTNLKQRYQFLPKKFPSEDNNKTQQAIFEKSCELHQLTRSVYREVLQG